MSALAAMLTCLDNFILQRCGLYCFDTGYLSFSYLLVEIATAVILGTGIRFLPEKQLTEVLEKAVLERLEPYDGKLSRTVREGASG